MMCYNCNTPIATPIPKGVRDRRPCWALHDNPGSEQLLKIALDVVQDKHLDYHVFQGEDGKYYSELNGGSPESPETFVQELHPYFFEEEWRPDKRRLTKKQRERLEEIDNA